VSLGVEFARKYKEREDIIHAIEAHHNDVEPRTVVACLVQAADAISAARPGARRENLENYIKRLEQLETITGSYPGVDKAYAIQAGREVRVMVRPEQVSEDQMVILARDLAKKIEEEMEYPGQIKVHVLRETKVIEGKTRKMKSGGGAGPPAPPRLFLVSKKGTSVSRWEPPEHIACLYGRISCRKAPCFPLKYQREQASAQYQFCKCGTREP